MCTNYVRYFHFSEFCVYVINLSWPLWENGCHSCILTLFVAINFYSYSTIFMKIFLNLAKHIKLYSHVVKNGIDF